MRRYFLIAFILLLSTGRARSQAGSVLFQQGSTRLSVGGGYGTFNDHGYGIVGLGAGYYVMNGLEAGMDGEAWLGAKPHIYTISPRLTYVLYQGEQWKPYIGGFYKRTFYDTLADLNSAGARAGIISPLNDHLYVSAGLVYESYFHCDKATYTDCSLVYPELGISFAY